MQFSYHLPDSPNSSSRKPIRNDGRNSIRNSSGTFIDGCAKSPQKPREAETKAQTSIPATPKEQPEIACYCEIQETVAPAHS